MTRRDDLQRIARSLESAALALSEFTPGEVEAELKAGGDPLTMADLTVNRVLHEYLPEEGEGWLSEETADDRHRLDCERVWVVDPIDGTREFIQGIPEWCVSVGLLEAGRPVAGGILNPATGELILGAEDLGVTRNGVEVGITRTSDLRGALVLASRSEVKRREWSAFWQEPVSVRNVGSVAYKLGLVAAGLADATWTLVPKHEWDVVGGAALVMAAGGVVMRPDGDPVLFNQENPKLPGFVATGPGLREATLELIGRVGRW